MTSPPLIIVFGLALFLLGCSGSDNGSASADASHGDGDVGPPDAADVVDAPADANQPLDAPADANQPLDAPADANQPLDAPADVLDAQDPCLALDCIPPTICVSDGTSAQCACPSGYDLDPEGPTCTDIDECARDPSPCGSTSTCRNTDGSFACDCEVGRYFDGDACVRHVETVSAGAHHACQVQGDGSLHCWGHNQATRSGRSPPPYRFSLQSRLGGDDDWRSVSVNEKYGCAIRTDDSLWCWGLFPGHPPDPLPPFGSSPTKIDDTYSWAMVDAGPSHACALTTSDELHCWGSNTLMVAGYPLGLLGDPDLPEMVETPTAISSNETWVVVSAGHNHSCALQSDGDLYCWGDNLWGALGDGTAVHRSVPSKVAGEARWTAVSAGVEVTCAIRTDGTLWCWGNNRFGLLGLDPAVVRGAVTNPAQVGTRTDWRQVSLGQFYGCAIRSDGSLHCWGELIPGLPPLEGPTQIGTANDWEEVTVHKSMSVVREQGGGFACGRRSDGVYCWGYDLHGTLGQGRLGSKTAPVRVDTAEWRSVSTTWNRTLAVRGDGTLWWWGQRNHTDPFETIQEPAQLGSASDWQQVHVGTTHQCALKEAGALYCWGDNRVAQIGIGSVEEYIDTPTRVGSHSDWSLVRAGAFGTCGIRAGGELYCWGMRASGEEIALPTRVGVDDDWTDVSLNAGTVYICGIRGGQAYCWEGGSRVEEPSSVSGGGTDWTKIDVSWTTNDGGCGLNNGGQLWCWDRLSSGSSRLGTIADFQDVQTTTLGECGRRADSTLWCMRVDRAAEVEFRMDENHDDFGQVGDGRVFSQVSMSDAHTCAIAQSENSLWCWGSNAYGVLGTGDAWVESPTFVP